MFCRYIFRPLCQWVNPWYCNFFRIALLWHCRFSQLQTILIQTDFHIFPSIFFFFFFFFYETRFQNFLTHVMCVVLHTSRIIMKTFSDIYILFLKESELRGHTYYSPRLILRFKSCRMIRSLWQTRVSPNVIYSMHHLRNYTSTLAVGGIDGVLRIVDHNTGKVLSRCILDENSGGSTHPEASNVVVTRKKGRRISEDTRLDLTHKTFRPSINSLAVGFQKVVTTHSDSYIRVWKFKWPTFRQTRIATPVCCNFFHSCPVYSL